MRALFSLFFLYHYLSICVFGCGSRGSQQTTTTEIVNIILKNVPSNIHVDKALVTVANEEALVDIKYIDIKKHYQISFSPQNPEKSIKSIKLKLFDSYKWVQLGTHETHCASKACSVIIDVTNYYSDLMPSLIEGGIHEVKKTSCVRFPPTSNITWYQIDKNKRNIVILQSSSNILNIKLEVFDNNTHIYCVMDDEIRLSYNIQVKPGVKDNYDNETETLAYDDINDVEINCDNYQNEENVTQYIGIMNTNFTINMYEGTRMNERFNDTDDGSTVFCIYYKVQQSEVQRVVNDKSVLKFTIAKEEAYSVIDIAYNIMLGAGGVMIGLLIIALIIYLIKRANRRFGEEQIIEPTNGSDTHRQNDQVTYADIEFLSGPSTKMPPRKEESPYAEVVGYLAPR